MVFEEIELHFGEVLSQIALDNGYNSWDWKDIWEHSGNSEINTLRSKPENLKAGDKIIIPIPWKIISKSMSTYTNSNRYGLTVKRDGTKGTNLRYILLIIVASFVTSCNNNSKAVDTLNLNTTVQEKSVPFQIDTAKALKSKAIVRAKLLEAGVGDKYLFSKIEISEVLVNKTDFAFGKTLYVGHYSWKSAIPEDKECIIYLAPYPYGSDSLSEKGEWMLLEGDGEYACECE